VDSMASRKNEFYFDPDDAECTSDVENLVLKKTTNYKTKKKKEAILYASGIRVDTITFPITKHFNLANLKTILDVQPEHIPGLSCSYMYIGDNHSGFSWHIEDGALFSANYHHYGAPSIWFVTTSNLSIVFLGTLILYLFLCINIFFFRHFVAPKYYSKFLNSIKYFPLDLGHVTCNNVLGHKYVIASKDYLEKFGIPVKTVS